MSKVSVVIPSRNERFLQKTIDDLFAKAQGEIEIIAVLDGYWPDPPLKDHKGLVPLHFGAQQGMRPGINAAMNIATGEWLMKLDGHCMVDEGFDVKLQADCDKDWVVIPRRYSLEPEAWVINTARPTVDYHYLSYPYLNPDDVACGLHGNVWHKRAKQRSDPKYDIDDEMSSQGSCYFMHRSYWPKIGPLDIEHYGTFAQEFQEVGNKCWLGGGQVKVNKKTWYAHLHKGKTYGTGYGFSNAQWKKFIADNKMAHDYTIDYWLNDRWEGRVHDFKWLLRKFAPVPDWPEEWYA
jgi:glycosyltransferase involved in cell wall biosynthesis